MTEAAGGARCASGSINRRLLLAGVASLALPLRVRAGTPDEPWDVVVVGGGNAGLPAAIFAAQRGARVLIVDAAPSIGGTLFLSTGQMSAAGTKLQKSRGIADTPQSHYDDIMRISRGTADPVLLRLAVDHAAAAFDWLTDHGFQVLPGHPETGTTHEPYSHARYAWGAEGGRSILKVLNAQLQPLMASGRVVVLPSSEIVELLPGRGGAVGGVVAKSADGTRTKHAAHHVALTCGGYTYNPAMYERLEHAKTYTRMTYPYSRGAGVDLATAVGGYVRGGEKHTPLFGAVLAGDTYPSTMRAMVRHFPGNRPPWEIYVNSSGRRFMREDLPSHNEYEQGLVKQPDERCWVVFDEAIRRAAPPLVGAFGGGWTPADTERAFAQRQPMFYRADSLAGLAAAAGIDRAGFEKSVADYNRAQAGGTDALGRRYMPLPIATGPFYAIRLQSWNLTSYGGVAVDERLRVVRRDGRAIQNLYAAGELLGMGQLMGRAVCGGMSVMPALTLGRVLGHSLIPLRT